MGVAPLECASARDPTACARVEQVVAAACHRPPHHPEFSALGSRIPSVGAFQPGWSPDSAWRARRTGILALASEASSRVSYPFCAPYARTRRTLLSNTSCARAARPPNPTRRVAAASATGAQQECKTRLPPRGTLSRERPNPHGVAPGGVAAAEGRIVGPWERSHAANTTSTAAGATTHQNPQDASPAPPAMAPAR